MVCHFICISSSHFLSGDTCIQNWKDQPLQGSVSLSVLGRARITLDLSLLGSLGDLERRAAAVPGFLSS